MTRHVLVPFDGSEPAWNALEHAVESSGADRVTVLHVVDPTELFYGEDEEGYPDAEAFRRAVERGENLCDSAREHHRERGDLEVVDLETAVKIGKPARMIVEFTDDNDVDHVVMGSHGRSGVSRILLGSVAEAVVRRSAVPVTIVP